MKHSSHSLNIKAFALSLGLLWSFALFLISITALFTDTYLHSLVDIVASWYIGYSLSFSGILIGVSWAFIDAGFGGLVFAWLYNKLNSFKCCQPSCDCEKIIDTHTNCCDSSSTNEEDIAMEDKPS